MGGCLLVVSQLNEAKGANMKISVKESDLKINFGGARAVLEYTLTDSILKTHFKELMRLTTCYDGKKKSGYITEKEEEGFRALVEKINKSDSKKAKYSHEKTRKKARERYSKPNCDHGDLGSRGYTHGTTVKCPDCGKLATVW